MSKRVSIDVPDSVSESTAQTCFILGMKTYVSCYDGGLCVTHGVEDPQQGLRLRMEAFRGEYAAAFYRFLQAIEELKARQTSPSEDDRIAENLEYMREMGKKIIHEAQYGKEK